MAFDDYDIGEAFSRIEEELIDSMMRNLGRHLAEEQKEGFDWSQWQVEQLKHLNEYRRKNQKKYGPQFDRINKKMVEMIREAEKRGQKDEELRILRGIADDKKMRRRYANKKPSVEAQGDAFFRTSGRKLEALVDATQNDMQKAEHAVLRRANDQYRQIIYDAQVFANTGASTPQKAIDMATKDFLSHGIDSIVYKNGSRHTISDYADMYIRTAERRATLVGEGKKRQEWGEHLVIVNKRGGTPCPHCIQWIGKILIDDVYSGGKPDGKHKLLSQAMDEGFLHPRCKDGFTTYIPGITKTPDPVTKEEKKAAVKAEEKENRENYVERQADKWERLANTRLDPENKKICEERAEEWRERKADDAYDNYARSLIDELLNPEEEAPIEWPERGERMGRTKAKKLREYGKQKGIDIVGLADYDLPESSVMEIIDDAEKYLHKYPELNKGRHRISFTAKYMNSSRSFAGTTNAFVAVNADAYRNLKRLEEEYQKLVAKHWFPQGTDHHALIAHEIGHVIHHHYPEIEPIEIAMRISGKSSKTILMEYISEHLSEYAAYYKNGQEIISECYACVLTGTSNDFALKFVQECDKIIKKKREEVL